MPINHPYALSDRTGAKGTRVHCSMPFTERQVLAAYAPQHGAFEPILATLLNNLINDVRLLNPTGDFDPRGGRILEILLEPRRLSLNQLARLSAIGVDFERLGG